MSDPDQESAGRLEALPNLSRFDLLLDRWAKISTILIGVLGLVVTSLVTVWVVLPGHSREALRACQSAKFDAVQIIRESPQAGGGSLAEDVSKLCDGLDVDGASQFLAEFRVDSEIASETRLESAANQATSKPPLAGFVSLGRVDDYQSSNFRFFDTDEKVLKSPEDLRAGTILIARWSVNLRENSSSTESGNNPIVTVIHDQSCIQLSDMPERLRGSFWGSASMIQCPDRK